MLNALTHLLTLWRSRDQPSLGPAVARTPPLLNSPSGRLSSKLNVVDWLLFNLNNKTLKLNTWKKEHSEGGCLQVFYSLPKELFYSFGFFSAFWSSGERVGAVAIVRPLRQPCQIEMVRTLSFCFSCANKCQQISISIMRIRQTELLHRVSAKSQKTLRQAHDDSWEVTVSKAIRSLERHACRHCSLPEKRIVTLF